jgi:hypothetical protein
MNVCMPIFFFYIAIRLIAFGAYNDGSVVFYFFLSDFPER